MLRAGLFIGVDRTGGLPRLKDAASGAARMHAWALSQGLADGTEARLLTDANGGKVTSDAVYDAVQALIGGAGVDQLVIYFAGHGVNINRGEQWLLSDAPVRTSAAVDVSNSAKLARYSGVSHVVFLSDACRVAPDSIQAQNVRGIDIFPNDDASDRARPVDEFYACRLGRTAAEVKDAAAAAGAFRALYTGALLEVLAGQQPALLAPGEAGDLARYVWPVPLQNWLEAELPRRIRALALSTPVIQDPDAVLSAEGRWLARFDPSAPLPPPLVPAAGPAADPRSRDAVRTRGGPISRGPAPTAAGLTRRVMQDALDGRVDRVTSVLGAAAGTSEVREVVAMVDEVRTAFGPDHHETGCGIKVRGADVTRVVLPDEYVERTGVPDVADFRIGLANGPRTALVHFASGDGALVPVFRGFLTQLTVREGELVDVAFEPSSTDGRYGEWQAQADRLRTLRAAAAAATREGRFRLDGAGALKLAQQMQYSKALDPSLAVYAAYAYDGLQERDRLRSMLGYLEGDLERVPFDVMLLAGALRGRAIDRGVPVVPFVPLLAQGWAQLQAHRVRLPPRADGLDRRLRDSPWALYDAEGVAVIEDILLRREVW